MKKLNFYKVAGILGIIALVVGMVFTNLSCKKEPEVYKIGAILPLTGNLAFLGEPERNAIEMALEEINAKGGINGKKLEILIQDSKGDAKEGVSIANKFIGIDRLKVIITSLSTVGLAVQPITDKNKIVQMALCMHPTIADKSAYTFRVFDNIWQESEVILSYIERLKPKRVAILYARVPEQESSAKEYITPGVSKLGGEVVLIEPYEMTQRDFSAIVTKIKGLNPDILVIMGFGHTYPSLFKALHTFELLQKVKIVGGLGFLELPPGTPLELFEGVVFAAPSFEVGAGGEKGEAFIDEYKTKYGKMPPFDAGYMYDAVSILAETMKIAGYKPNRIKDTLLTFKKFEGVTGNIEILPNGDSRVDLVLSVYKNSVHIPL